MKRYEITTLNQMGQREVVHVTAESEVQALASLKPDLRIKGVRKVEEREAINPEWATEQYYSSFQVDRPISFRQLHDRMVEEQRRMARQWEQARQQAQALQGFGQAFGQSIQNTFGGFFR